ncbi:MAG TPA: SCO family protein, partial [Trebonia sp.]|nr:SCO family protein [Trebonia sp.]
FAVNLVAVIALAVIGAALVIAAVRADARLALLAVIAGTVFCLADWVLIEDLGVFGGLGTDPNSMIPLIVLFTAGYLGLAPVPQFARRQVPAVTGPADLASAPTMLAAPVPDAAASPALATAQNTEQATRENTEQSSEQNSGQDTGEPSAGRALRLVCGFARTPAGVVLGAGALAVVLVGTAPMALAAANPNADPITAQAIAGSSGQFDTPAANFTLTSQNGEQVALSSLRGKVVLLTFLDPVCTTDCPLIAQEMKSADALLGTKAGSAELVAVVANPTYLSTAYVKEFTAQENLSEVPNWLFLTGSLNQLKDVWHDYGIEVENLPAGAMAAHNDLAIVIDANGTIRQELSDDPGPGTSATKASFASLLADSVAQTMSKP